MSGRVQTDVADGGDALDGVAMALAAGGSALLALRPELLRATGSPGPTLVVVFGALLVVGAAGPVAGTVQADGTPAGRRLGVLLLGVGAFALARLVGGGEPPVPGLGAAIALSTLAAVAEEAFFRRFVYGTLASGGVAVAVVGSAVLFAVVHLSIYGPWSLPVDVAAGLLLSWQRLASGSWHVPAVTHALANVLVVI